jgi:lipid A 4'-phosphatase
MHSPRLWQQSRPHPLPPRAACRASIPLDRRACENWRINGAFLLLSVIAGPGLIINAVLKDHWDRPRPRDVVQFGGVMQYTPAPLRGEGGGAFPCGHCSVGFLYASGWLAWRRRRPAWART